LIDGTQFEDRYGIGHGRMGVRGCAAVPV